MRLTGTRTYYRSSPPKMPPGLVELMEGLTKEVLKHNPSDVYGFCAKHMQQLLDKRDGPSLSKSLSLEEKIARAQAKVRQKAENRRQEYDKNVLLQQQNSKAANAAVKENTTLQIPDNVNLSVEKDNVISPVCDNVIQNIVKRPIHQTLEDSGEMEISHDKPKNDIHESQNNEVNVENLHDSETAHLSEKCQSVTVTNYNEQIANDISSSTQLDTATINKEMINNNNSDIAKSVSAIDQLNENRENNITNEKQDENNLQKHEPLEIESKKSLTIDNVDIAKDNDKVENSKQGILNEIVEVGHSLSESSYDQVPLENSKDNEKMTNEDILVQIPINLEEVYKSTNFETYSNVLTTDLRENKSKNSQELILENDTEQKCDDVQPFNNTTNSDNENDKQQYIENKLLKVNDILENIPHVDLSPTDMDSDIRTLVTDSSMNDTNEINGGSDTLQLKSMTFLDNTFEVNEENSNFELKSAGNIRDYTKQGDNDSLKSPEKVSNGKSNDSTSQDTTSTTINEKNKNENQGNNVDLETAAITIQKVFRNFLFKSRGSTFEDTANDGNFLEEEKKEECNFPIGNSLNTDRRAHGITRMDTVLQTVNEEKSLSLSTDDSSTLSSAATIIQAHVRGFLVRNKLNSNKTVSTASLANNSNEPSCTSIEAGSEHNKNRNILNIHIVPEGENCLSRDESLIMSTDLSLDSSPPSSINLHPLGYDKSERRKLKREDAIQSISPPSNNSGKLSEDFDSVKEISERDHEVTEHLIKENKENEKSIPVEYAVIPTDLNEKEIVDISEDNIHIPQTFLNMKRPSLTKMNSDEMDVVTPFMSNEDLTNLNLTHSGEFHDAVLPTRVSRSDTSVVRGE